MSDDWKPGDLLAYDALTGAFVWQVRPRQYFRTNRDCNAWNGHHAGRPVKLRCNHEGYSVIRIGRKDYRAQRLAWEIMNGPIGDGLVIDHINGDRADNRLANLRAVTQQENLRNARLHRRNKSGATGVRPSGAKWQAEIWNGTRRVHLGTFADKAAAVAARKSAEAELGFHENHGRPLTDEEREQFAAELNTREPANA